MRSLARPAVKDAAAAALLVAFTLLGTRGAAENQHDVLRDLDALGYALAGLAAATLLARRVAPLLTVGACGVLVATYLGAGYAYGPVFVALALAALSAAARLPLGRSLPTCAAVFAIVLAGLGVRIVRDDAAGASVTLLAAGWLVVPWSVGTVLRQRSESRTRTRREEADQAIASERLRIAAEVHDVAGHGLAVIALQAGVALHVLERRPEQARIALEEIRAASTEALDGLRSTLEHLRTPGSEVPRTPGPPGLDALDALLDRIRRAGLPVERSDLGVPVPLPVQTGQAAYRIVQESLTNVLRHASAQRATVALRWTAGFVVVTIADDGTGTPGEEGAGIAGMRRRVDDLGGVMDAGALAGGGYEVRASLPRGATGARWRIDGGSADGTGSDGTGSDGTGSDGTGSDGAGSDGTGSDGTGSDGTGSDGTGSDGTGSDGTGSDGTGSDGTGSDGTGSDGTGSDGTGSDGTGSDGTGSDGTGSDGTGSDGTGSDGTGSDGAEERA